MSEEDWNVQASYKFGPNTQNMLNVRAGSVASLAETCASIADQLQVDNFLGDLGDALVGPTATQAATTITNVFPGAQPVTGGQLPPPMCSHGPMKDLSAKNYKKRWYCNAPYGTPREAQCPARD